MKSYECVVEKSIVEVKEYLLKMATGRFEQDIYDIINCSIDNRQLKQNIQKRKDVELDIFLKIKKMLDNSTTLDVVEKHLIFINILLDDEYKPLIKYKYNLFNYIIDRQGFTIENYCILRHLIKFNSKQLPQFIIYMCNRLNLNDHNYITSNILLLEKEYKLAYKYLAHIELDDNLKKYQPGLYNYSPRKFNKYIKNVRVEKLTSVLN